MGQSSEQIQGFFVVTQNHQDNKTNVDTLAQLKNLGANDSLAYSYPNGMIVNCTEQETQWIWRQAEVDEIGLITQHFVYPAGHIVNDFDYSLKKYNFFKISKENNIKREILIDCPANPNAASFATAINNLPLFIVKAPEIYSFKCISPAEEVTFYVEILDVGKGTYGIGGEVILNALNIKLTFSKTEATEIPDLPTTQIIDYGVQNLTVLQAINTGATVIIQSQEVGYVIIKGIFNGIEETYLWIGEAGVYGAIATVPAVKADLELISGAAPTSSSQDNLSRVIYVGPGHLNGVGSIEEQIAIYVNSLNYFKRETDADVWVEYDTELTVPTPVNCQVSEWGEWSECGPNSTKTRNRTIVIAPANGGGSCPILVETVACVYTPPAEPIPNTDAEMSAWSAWSSCSSNGTQTRTRTVITPASGTGTTPSTTETQSCNYVAPVEPTDCVLSKWTDWTACDNSSQSRYRTVITPAANGGTACGSTMESRACTMPTPVTPFSMTSSRPENGLGTLDIVGGEPNERINLRFNLTPSGQVSWEFDEPTWVPILDNLHKVRTGFMLLNANGEGHSNYYIDPSDNYGNTSCLVTVTSRTIGTTNIGDTTNII